MDIWTKRIVGQHETQFLSERSIDLTTVERAFEYDFERGFRRRTLLRGLSQSSSSSDLTFVSNARFRGSFHHVGQYIPIGGLSNRLIN